MATFENRPKNADSLHVDHLRAFLAVVDSTQVDAARRLGVGQAKVSRNVKRVQEHFGGGLFESGSSGALSSRGKLIEESVRAALGLLDGARDRTETDRPVLRIGFNRLARPLVERALRSLHGGRAASSFEVRLFELTSQAQARALAHRELDLAVGFDVPELTARTDIERTLVADLPFALVLPERAWLNGKPSRRALRGLCHVHPPRRFVRRTVEAAEAWLASPRLTAARTLEHALATEIIAYAAAGHGFGFLPTLWKAAASDGAVFAPVPSFGVTAGISVYTQRQVTARVADLLEALLASARTVLANAAEVSTRPHHAPDY